MESANRRVVVATNIAETSLTVPGVTGVIDSGLQKAARYDAGRGIDALDVERITKDAADQRAGRAGRIAPGVVVRLWDARDRLRPHRQPEIMRVDLAGAVLDVIAWGGDPRSLDWIERPPADALEAAFALLGRLELVVDGALTDLGERVRRLPLHPRLARMVIAGGGSHEIVRACAALSERLGGSPEIANRSTSSDLLRILDSWPSVPWTIKRTAEEISRIARASGIESTRQRLDDEAFRLAVLAGYPDRIAQRRAPNSLRFRLASGAGAVLTEQSGVTDGEFVVALDVRANRQPERNSRHGPDTGDARIVLASRVEREWLVPTASDIVHRYDDATGSIRAARIERYDALILAEHPAPVDPAIAAPLLAACWLERGPQEDDRQLLRRVRFAGLDVDVDALVEAAAWTARRVQDITLATALPREIRIDLDRAAPESLVVPSGRAVRLEYDDDGSVSASVKLQELFGLAETPRIGPNREPVRFSLLAPNGRPVQVTRDLRSFWDRTYPEVRKELRGRYPKHPWPDDPWTATPSARTKRQ